MKPAEVTHFTMVFPGEDMSVKPEDFIATEVGETKEIIIAWGHPYEHVLFDCPENLQVHVRKPDGTTLELTPTETTIQGHKAYKVSYTVDQKGDSLIYVRLVAPEHGLIDYTKTFIHCGLEQWKGWDADVGQEVEVIPYTRPYGMEEGFVFSGKALYNGQELSNATVEVEKYHQKERAEEIVSEAEEKYPYDPPMMYTRVTKTNSDGDFSYTLDEPGIWYVGATKEVEVGYPRRGVFQLPILEEFPTSSESGSSTTGQLAGVSSTLVYSAIGVAIIALIIAIVAVRKK
ncbi:hypothetical protein AKJ39_01320 [candidate division MSBL1 archaeon SCGC-AAA259J03]|uniref:Nickel transporter n=1 Tax=candidate division MSBL1 archaeon SCGC-AAA259J03 TaxID=1698269 RepID=A0A656YX46_9EURY|nr:hypothetical protein AKJ39_01320 [candidate division MSBL1 archaeon SCGC-AAA259J03]